MGNNANIMNFIYFCIMERSTEINGVRVVYEESGNPDGKPIILLHGWGCNHTTVSSIAKCLEPELKIFSLDLPGHGKSDEPQEVWGTDDFARMVVEFIRQHNLHDPVLIGHSFGGRTSLAVSSILPISKMILVDSAGLKPKRSLKYYYKVYSYKTLKKLARVLLGEEKAKSFIEKQVQKRGSADYNASSPKMRAIMSKCVNEDLRKRFPSIKASTLLVWGENDTATPLKDAKVMEKMMPDAGLVTFPNAGHYSFLDNPFGFKAVVREFLKPEINE